MAERLFENASISVPCLGCGHKNKKTVGWLRDHTDLTCEGCGTKIKIDNADFRSELGRSPKTARTSVRNSSVDSPLAS
jgi:ribosomal protein S27E